MVWLFNTPYLVDFTIFGTNTPSHVDFAIFDMVGLSTMLEYLPQEKYAQHGGIFMPGTSRFEFSRF
jgi:hypothetical protein